MEGQDLSCHQALPGWLRRPLPPAAVLNRIKSGLRKAKLHTVCESARCPNLGECFSRQTATFMILGNVCTRSCGFCNVRSGQPLAVEEDEVDALVASVRELNLTCAVLTSVTRDDLPDGGARHFRRCVEKLHNEIPGITVEVLIPDFEGKPEPLEDLLKAEPEVLNHNLETVRRLTQRVRNKAEYDRSLELLKRAKSLGARRVKSGIMVGLGESLEECSELFTDLSDAGCDILTIGQYLRPSEDCLPVERFLPPEEFDQLAERAKAAGIREVFASPFARSSYRAEELLNRMDKSEE